MNKKRKSLINIQYKHVPSVTTGETRLSSKQGNERTQLMEKNLLNGNNVYQ
jgi:hypothetical protein